ncbi:MAG: hypothetical protein IJL25_12815, partial [Clostridia bacterium]|nr:hypothetical protein [Clostridia bacterium]
PASKVYVNNKKRACEKLGIVSYEYALPRDATQQQLLGFLKRFITTTSLNDPQNGLFISNI